MRLTRLKRLVHSARPITYGIVQAGEDVPDGVPYIRPVDMPEFARDLDPRTLRTTAHEIASAYRRSTLRAGDLVVSIGPSYGKLLVVSARLEGSNLTQGTARVAPARGVDVRFLQWALASPLVRAHWDAAVGGATFGGLNLGPLSMTPVPLLEARTQRAVADFLDSECARIGELRELLRGHGSSTDELERRLIDDVFDGVPDTRLGRRARVQTGLTLGGRYDDEELVERPYLRVANVQADHITTDDVARVHVPERVARRTSLRAGDVLMTEGGDIDKLGRGAVWDGRIDACLHQNHVFAVRCGDLLLPELLAIWTRSSVARAYFESTASRITNIASTNLTKLLRLPVPDLDVATQRSILARYYERRAHVAELRQLVEQVDNDLAEYRDALIAEAVTGRLDVRNVSEQQLAESADAVLEGAAPEVLSA